MCKPQAPVSHCWWQKKWSSNLSFCWVQSVPIMSWWIVHTKNSPKLKIRNLFRNPSDPKAYPWWYYFYFFLFCFLNTYGDIWVPKHPLSTSCKQTYIFGKRFQKRHRWLWTVKAPFGKELQYFTLSRYLGAPIAAATGSESTALYMVSVLEK